MAQRRERLLLLSIGMLLVALITLPYLLAYRAGGSESYFAGFLLNPIDGQSYLAKMQQGCRGSAVTP